MSNVIKKENTVPVEYKEGVAWGSENVESEDIILPKIMLMQALSQKVSDGTAKVGQWVDSLEDELITDTGKEFSLIVFGFDKALEVYQNDKYVRTEAFSSNYEREERDMQDNIIVRKVRQQFYGLRPEDIAKGEAFPYVLNVRSTAIAEGKKLTTGFKKLQAFGKPSASRHVIIGSKKSTNEKGTWTTPTFTLSKTESTTEEMNIAYKWYQSLMSNKLKVDDSDLETSKEVKKASSTEKNDPVDLPV